MIENNTDFVPILGVACAVLLVLAVMAGIIAVVNIFKVREFQSLLHKADRKIDQLDRRMFHVLNAVPVALVETDNTGKFTFANKAAHMLLGRKDSELLGLRYHAATWGITYPDGRVIPPDLLPIARTLRGQTVKGFQHLIAQPQSQKKMLVSVTSMPITNANGEVIGSTSAIVELDSQTGEGVGDITGAWRGQWFTQASVPFWGLDQDGTVLDINPAALELLDLKREDVVGHNWIKFFADSMDVESATHYLSQAALGPKRGETLRSALIMTVRGSPTKRARTALKAWKVITLDGLAEGMTVMAEPLADGIQMQTASPVPPMPIAAPVAAALSDDDSQKLADLKKAETSRAELGVGVWFFDRQSDCIVEDEGMRRLIGREIEGGPTRISESDQARADEAFSKIMSGETHHLEMEIAVDHPGGQKWIALKGQAHQTPEGLDIFGVATDITEVRNRATQLSAAMGAPLVSTPEPETKPVSEPIKSLPHDPYAWTSDDTVRVIHVPVMAPVAIEPDPELEAQRQAELESLRSEIDRLSATQSHIANLESEMKAQHQAELEALKSEIDRLSATQSHTANLESELKTQHQAELDSLKSEIERLSASQSHTANLESEIEALKSAQDHAAQLEAELEHLKSAHQLVMQAHADASHELESLTTQKSRTEAQESELAELRARHADLAERAGRADAALILAQRYETVGRLTGNVAQDFQQMLNVINNALDMIQKQSDNPDHIRRLSEAALAAGKRGERLTRQLQAFAQMEDEPAE